MADWEDHFVYSPSSPSGLVWVNDRLAGFNNKTVNALAGDVAGSINNQGYWMVYHVTSCKNISCHRIIYEIHNGEVQHGFQIDHIDGNRGNNLISNLRRVSCAVNSRNQKKRSDNTSGVQGVYWNENKKGNRYAVAMWNEIDGTEGYKYFSVTKLGSEIAFEKACEYRKDMIERLNTQGAGYSKRHGEQE